MNARIIGTGSYLPEQVLSNEDLIQMGLETSDEWIRTRTGIKERRKAPPEQCTSDLGLQAARRALETAGLTPDQIDLIVFSTITPDTHCPSAAAWLQGKLGATRAVAFDVNAACSGFVFALTVAEQFIKAGTARYVLVVAGETMTRTVDYRDRASCILWGDGAGAAVLTQATGTNGRGRILSTHLHNDGSQADLLQYPGGGSRVTPITHETVDNGLHYIKMEGPESSKVAVRCFSSVIKEAIEANGVTADDVRWVVPHQANLRLIEMVARQLRFPMERIYLTIEKYGNMSSASCIVALDDAVKNGHVQEGDLLCMAAFAGGLAWGSALIRW
ncbi:MAG: beta-ketoacyl-ACP synthase III, partial [Candidatus Xenobia bacterium]